MRARVLITLFRGLLVLLLLSQAAMVEAQCSSVTPTFTLDLSGNPNSSSVTPLASRLGTCCGGSVPCVKIVVLLNPNAMALQLTPQGADPGGALNYEFNCNGVLIPGGTPVCLSGTGPQTLTICKVGNNANSYSVNSIPRPSVQDTLIVRGGCTTTLHATGYSVPTITWTAINAGTNTALFNSYLSCTSACASVVVSPTTTVPVPYIDYVVSGYGQAPCQTAFYTDTARVFFYTDLTAVINPTTICFGSTSAVLHPTVTGGKTPHTFTWSTGSNSSSITVGAGNYTVTVGDQTGCPPVTATVAVGNFTLPITANGGPDVERCKSNPNVPLSGTITSASGGTWSAGSGTFTPSNSALSATYIPSAGEVSSGSVQIILGTTGNQGCPPDEDTIIVTFQNQPTITATQDQTVCANNNVSLHSAAISGYSATAVWSAPGGGTLSPPSGLITTFYPTLAQVNGGSALVVVTTTNNGACPGDSDSVMVHYSPSPTVTAGAGSQTICSNGIATLNGSVSPAAFTGSWSTSGDGTFSNASSLSTSYTPGTADITTGTVTLVMHATNLGNCNPVTDTIHLSVIRIATISVSGPTLICSSFTNVGLSSTVTGAAGTGSWSSSGSGIFSDINHSHPQYILSGADQPLPSITFSLTSTGNGVCPAVTQTLSMNIAQIATVNAGTNYQVCGSQGTLNLGAGNPTITGSTGTGTWSASGSGQLVPGVSYNASSYSITTTDISAGTVIFTLTSTNNGICPATNDTVQIRIVSTPSANAGPSQTICSTAGTVALSGTVTAGLTGSGAWNASGSGSFAPSHTLLSTTYSLTPADITAGSVFFNLTPTNPGPCPVQAHTTQVTVVSMATVLPGPGAAICSTQPSISLTGTVLGVSGTGTWSAGGSGAITPGSGATGVYGVTPGDISAGAVSFTLTSSNNGPCAAVSNTLTVPIILQPTVSAAVTPSLCSSSPTAILSGTVTGGSGTGNWATAGTGTFSPSSTSLNTNYVAGASDISGNGVLLIFASSNHSPCAAATATAFVQIQDPTTVTAAPGQVICSSQASVALSGTVLGTFNTGTWSASGSGGFAIPNGTTTTYTITNADVNAGSVTFTLTSTNNGACPAATATTQAQIIREATVTASPAQSVCSTSSITAISGTVSGGSGSGVWTSSGGGSFQPGNNILNTNYLFTPADVAAGGVQLILSSSNTSPCPVSSDTVFVAFQIPPQVMPATPPPICSTQSLVTLSGTVINTSNTGSWSTSGSGTLSPSGSIATSYTVHTNDIISGNVNFTLTSTNDGACASSSSVVTLNIAREATISASPEQTLCSSDGAAVVSGTVNGGSGLVQWTSEGSGTFQSPSQISTTYSFSTADINDGSILLTLSGINNAPCPVTFDTVRIFVQSPAQVNTGTYAAVCSSPGTIQLAGSIAGGKQTGIWSSLTSGEFQPAASDLSATYSITSSDVLFGAATLTLTSTNNGACPVIFQTVTIPVIQQATPVAMPDFSICSNQLIVPLSGTVTGNLSSVSWSTSGQGSITTVSQTQASYDLLPADISQGTIQFYLTAASNGPCPAVTDSAKMHITRRPVITLSSDTSVCSNESPIALNGQIADGSGDVLWASNGTGTFVPSNFTQDARYAFSVQDIEKGEVNLSLNSINNAACGSVGSTMKVVIRPSPAADFTPSSYTLTLPSDQAFFTNSSKGATSYTWALSDGSGGQSTDFSRNFHAVGFYTIELSAENEHGCFDTISRVIKVISSVKFPNAFTPNGDKLNDEFRPYTDGVVEYELMIYNRWGEMIFRSESLQKGWDGTFNGKVCQQDAYVWKARMVFFDGREFDGTGSVALLR